LARVSSVHVSGLFGAPCENFIISQSSNATLGNKDHHHNFALLLWLSGFTAASSANIIASSILLQAQPIINNSLVTM
jgi:hypothetical protein